MKSEYSRLASFVAAVLLLPSLAFAASSLTQNNLIQIKSPSSIVPTYPGYSFGVSGGGTGTTTGGVTNGVEYYNGSYLTNGTGLTFTGSNLGVGTTSPVSTFSVTGTSTFQGGTLYPNYGQEIYLKDAPFLTAWPGNSSTAVTENGQLFIGHNSGSKASATANYTTAVGAGAGQNLTGGQEDAAFGNTACQYATIADTVTCIGMHAFGYSTNDNGNTAIGNDSERNFWGDGNGTLNTAVGAGSLYGGGAAFRNEAFGFNDLNGNASSIILTGTPTTGDVMTFTFTSASSTLTLAGFPLTVNYTVTAGDTTLALLTTHVINAITAASPNSAIFSAGPELGSPPAGFIKLYFPGSGLTGWQLGITYGVTGAGTEKANIGTGFNGSNNVCMGAYSCTFGEATTSNQNVGIGGTNWPFLTGASSDNIGIGYGAGNLATSTSRNVFIGVFSGANFVGSGTSGNTCLGWESCVNMTTGANNLVLGLMAGTAQSGITTGSSNIVIGPSAQLPSPTASNQLVIQNIIYGTNNNLNQGNVNAGQIGIGVRAPQARFAVAANSGETNLNLLQVASSTALFSTTTLMNLSNQGNLTVGTTTPTFNNAALTLGAENQSTNGTTTVSMGKIQFDGYDSAGARRCMFLNAADTWTSIAGACTP